MESKGFTRKTGRWVVACLLAVALAAGLLNLAGLTRGNKEAYAASGSLTAQELQVPSAKAAGTALNISGFTVGKEYDLVVYDGGAWYLPNEAPSYQNGDYFSGSDTDITADATSQKVVPFDFNPAWTPGTVIKLAYVNDNEFWDNEVNYGIADNDAVPSLRGYESILFNVTFYRGTPTYSAKATTYTRYSSFYDFDKTIDISGIYGSAIDLYLYYGGAWHKKSSVNAKPFSDQDGVVYDAYASDLTQTYSVKVVVNPSTWNEGFTYSFTSNPPKYSAALYAKYDRSMHEVIYYTDNCPKGKLTLYYKSKKVKTLTAGYVYKYYKVPSKYRSGSKYKKLYYKFTPAYNYYASIGMKKLGSRK